MGKGFHGGGGDMTMVLLDVMMLGTLVVVLISWMSNMWNMIMIVVMLMVRDNVMTASLKGNTKFQI